MSKTATTTITYSCTGDGLNPFTYSYTYTNSSAIAPTGQVLGSGFTAVSIPTGAKGVTIIPPPTNTQTITLKGITGDTGLQETITGPIVLNWNDASSAPTSIGLTTGGAMSQPTMFLWN